MLVEVGGDLTIWSVGRARRLSERSGVALLLLWCDGTYVLIMVLGERMSMTPAEDTSEVNED